MSLFVRSQFTLNCNGLWTQCHKNLSLLGTNEHKGTNSETSVCCDHACHNKHWLLVACNKYCGPEPQQQLQSR